MSHYSNLVLIEPTEDVETAVKEAMGVHKAQGGFWDWYQIGGRWTGVLDGYNPDKDPVNIETCWLCQGTGTRQDMKVENGCNGCLGTGKKEKWPTKYAKHPGDIAPIETLTDESYKNFFRVVTPGCIIFGGEDYLPWKPVGEMFPEREMPPLDWLKENYKGYLAVVVDNHS